MSPGGGVSVPATAGAVGAEAVPAEEVPDEEVAIGCVTEDGADEHPTAAAPAVIRRTAGAMSRRDDLPARAAVSISHEPTERFVIATVAQGEITFTYGPSDRRSLAAPTCHAVDRGRYHPRGGRVRAAARHRGPATAARRGGERAAGGRDPGRRQRARHADRRLAVRQRQAAACHGGVHEHRR